MAEETKTLVVDNFHGSMTVYLDGDVNSGFTNVVEVFGQDPVSKPGNLTWNENAEQIDPDGDVITDMVLAGKVRVESGITYVYAIGHTGRVYKIQVNDPTTYNPNYDNPVLLTTLTINSPTFTRGGFMDFFGATEKIYIGHDMGVTSLNFDGTGEAFVGILGSWVQEVPRPFIQFIGKLFIGNGPNFAEIDSTATVTTYGKLSPAFPSATQVRDLDVTPDGNYIQAVVTELALGDITSATPETSIISPADSYVFLWNGTDVGYTSFVTYPATVLSANALFADYAYTFGYDFRGGGIFNPSRKLLTSSTTSAFGESPLPNAVIAMGNMITWMTTLPFEGNTEMLLTWFGAASDYEFKEGYWAPYNQGASGDETDVQRVPCQILISNFAQGPASNGYTDGIFGTPKIYFSTLETSATPTTAYKLYKWTPAPVGLGTAITGGVYQTQTQIFSKKVRVKEVRVYGEPWVAGNSLIVELIGSGGVAISGSEKTFTAEVNTTGIATSDKMIIGDDFAWYTPQMEPTYAIGLRITNNGDTNFTINKVEIDYTSGGK